MLVEFNKKREMIRKSNPDKPVFCADQQTALSFLWHAIYMHSNIVVFHIKLNMIGSKFIKQYSYK